MAETPLIPLKKPFYGAGVGVCCSSMDMQSLHGEEKRWCAALH